MVLYYTDNLRNKIKWWTVSVCSLIAFCSGRGRERVREEGDWVVCWATDALPLPRRSHRSGLVKCDSRNAETPIWQNTIIHKHSRTPRAQTGTPAVSKNTARYYKTCNSALANCLCRQKTTQCRPNKGCHSLTMHVHVL